jgi:hypothetical protein
MKVSLARLDLVSRTLENQTQYPPLESVQGPARGALLQTQPFILGFMIDSLDPLKGKDRELVQQSRGLPKKRRTALNPEILAKSACSTNPIKI